MFGLSSPHTESTNGFVAVTCICEQASFSIFVHLFVATIRLATNALCVRGSYPIYHFHIIAETAAVCKRYLFVVQIKLKDEEIGIVFQCLAGSG